MLALPVIRYLILERRRLLISPAFPVLVCFFGTQFLATIFAREKDAALDVLLVSLTEGVLLYFLLINAVRTREVLTQVTWALILAGAFLGGLGVVQQVTGTY